MGDRGAAEEGIAIEAMEAAIDDLWGRTDVEIITAYIEEGSERTISSPCRQPRIRGAGPRPRALGRADDGVRVRRDDWLRRGL